MVLPGPEQVFGQAAVDIDNDYRTGAKQYGWIITNLAMTDFPGAVYVPHGFVAMAGLRITRPVVYPPIRIEFSERFVRRIREENVRVHIKTVSDVRIMLSGILAGSMDEVRLGEPEVVLLTP